MLVNEHTGELDPHRDAKGLAEAAAAISTSKILLVPYCKHHVHQYHKWMQNPAIQVATASEPLTIAQEHAMQESWRRDADKLTFIICQPLPHAEGQTLQSVVQHEMDDSPDQMIGDVNLFLSLTNTANIPAPEPRSLKTYDGANADPLYYDPASTTNTVVDIRGELELMIPSPENQRRGYGRAALLTFLRYILTHQSALLTEFLASQPKTTSPTTITAAAAAAAITTNTISTATTTTTLSLTAKISHTNTSSLSLFQSLGFAKTSEEPDYFGEFELVGLAARDPGSSSVNVDVDADMALLQDDPVSGMMARWRVEGYRELFYA